MTDNILFSADSYKYTHDKMLPNNTQGVYSYFEARKGSKFPKTVFYGLQAILKKYFVGPVITQELINEADYLITRHIGPGIFNKEGWEYILKKYNGHLPLRIKAVKEGSLIDISNVLMTIENTDDKVPFLTNFAETILTHIWYPITVATTSYYGKLMLTNWLTTTSDKEGEDFNNILNFQLHDFGCRGTENFEASMLGGSAHLLNFNGTDTVPALLVPSRYYNENIDKMFGYSIRATEHSIMTSRGEEGEFGVVEELLNKNPDGIMAMVIDSYNYERFIEVCGTKFKDLILNRNGRIVFRPDSGDIIKVSQRVLELLGQYFGYTVNNKDSKFFRIKFGLFGVMVSILAIWIVFLKNLQKTAGHRKTGLLAWVEDFFKKLTEILAGLLLNVPPRSMTINGMMFKNVHWICQKLLRRGVCL